MGAISEPILCRRLSSSHQPNTVRLRPHGVRPLIYIYIHFAGSLVAALLPCQWLQLPRVELSRPQQFVSCLWRTTHAWPHTSQFREWNIFHSSFLLLSPTISFYVTSCFVKTVCCLFRLHSFRKSLEEAPLMTKSLRETQMKEKLERYPKVSNSDRHMITILFLNVVACMKLIDCEYSAATVCLQVVLRIQFPDRHVLQGFFRPLETGAYVFVCMCVHAAHWVFISAG